MEALAAAQASHNESCAPRSGKRQSKQQNKDDEVSSFRDWVLEQAKAKLNSRGGIDMKHVRALLPPGHPFLEWISKQQLSDNVSVLELGALCESYVASTKSQHEPKQTLASPQILSAERKLQRKLNERVGEDMQVEIKAGLVRTQLDGHVSNKTQENITDALSNIQKRRTQMLTHSPPKPARHPTVRRRGERSPREPSPDKLELKEQQALLVQRAQRVYGTSLGFGSALRSGSSDVANLEGESIIIDTGERRVEPADSSSPPVSRRSGVIPLSHAISTVGRSPPHTPNVHISLVS